MEIHQHIKTRIGDIWIVNAEENNFTRSEIESRHDYEARVLQVMLQKILGNVELDHESNGAPVLKDRPELNISISHSDKWFAVYTSLKKPVGVDIEIDTEQIEKTKKYFLTESEIERLQPSAKELKTCWGIKESVYKMLRGEIQSLKDEVEIIYLGENEAKANFKNQNIILRHQQTEFFTLVYTD